MKRISIIGAGLAGSEAALQLADRGFSVRLVEMRPEKGTPVHKTGLCAELVEQPEEHETGKRGGYAESRACRARLAGARRRS